jgi:aspartyl-tRNA(Asn)/glutamyl-tRNA(Gln) amidotransferase subunit A
MGRTVDDAAALLSAMVSPRREQRRQDSNETITSLRGVRVGVPDGYFAADNHPDVDGALARAYRLLEQAGAVLVPVTVGKVETATATGFLTVIPEAVVSIERALSDGGVAGPLASHLDQFGNDVREAMAGEVGPRAHPVAAHHYARAISRAFPAIRRAFTEVLDTVDVILTATTPATAIPISEREQFRHNGRLVSTFETFVRYTFCVSIAGLPAISVPAGMDSRGLPIGVQLVGSRWGEARLISIGRELERIVG